MGIHLGMPVKRHTAQPSSPASPAFGAARSGSISTPVVAAPGVVPSNASDLAQHLGENGLRALTRLSFDRTGIDWLRFLGKAASPGEAGVPYASLNPVKAGLDSEFSTADWQDLFRPLVRASLVRLDETTVGLTPFGQSVVSRLESCQPTTNRISASLQALGEEAARIMASIRANRSEFEGKLTMLESWQRQVEARQNPGGAASFSTEWQPETGNTMAPNPSASEQEQLAYQRAMLTNQRAQFQFSIDRIDEDRTRYIQIFQDPERTRPQVEQLKGLLQKPPTLLRRAISWIYGLLQRLLGFH